jgi:hypothetical protein
LPIQLLPPPAPHDVVTARPADPPSPVVRAWARVVMEALFSTESGPPDAARVEDVLDDFLDFVARAPLRGRLIMALSLFVLVWLAPLFVGRLPTLDGLELDKRAEALDRVEHGLFGPAALAPKAILCLLWFEHPATRVETRTEVTCLLP